MAERLNSDGVSVFASAKNYGAVTASDSTSLNFKALYVGTTGNVVIKKKSDSPAVTFANVPVGFFSVAGVRVMAATTASDIVWLSW